MYWVSNGEGGERREGLEGGLWLVVYISCDGTVDEGGLAASPRVVTAYPKLSVIVAVGAAGFSRITSKQASRYVRP